MRNTAPKDLGLNSLNFREGNEESFEETTGCEVSVYEKFDDCPRTEERVEILQFTQFFDHFVFTPNAQNVLEKELKREIPVSVGIELVVVDM